MQTFLPEGSQLPKGFKSLDRMRLGKQRVEAWQILNVLRSVDNEGNHKNHKGWVHHPAVRMWVGHSDFLAYYGYLCCTEWIKRGYKDTLRDRFDMVLDACDSPIEPPQWIDRYDFVTSHRSNLIRKNPEHYGPLWPLVSSDLPYIWPKS